MDLSTMRKKLDGYRYPNAQAFFADFRLLARSCFWFGPAGTPVSLTGIKLQRLFDDKWKNLPQPKPHPAYDDDMMPRVMTARTTITIVCSLFSLHFPILTEALSLGITEMEKQIEAMQ